MIKWNHKREIQGLMRKRFSHFHYVAHVIYTFMHFTEFYVFSMIARKKQNIKFNMFEKNLLEKLVE